MNRLIEALQATPYMIADGSKGYPLSYFARCSGDPPDLLVLQDAARVSNLHEAYKDAGALLHQTCTFRANPLVKNLAIGVKDLHLKRYWN